MYSWPYVITYSSVTFQLSEISFFLQIEYARMSRASRRSTNMLHRWRHSHRVKLSCQKLHTSPVWGFELRPRLVVHTSFCFKLQPIFVMSLPRAALAHFDVLLHNNGLMFGRQNITAHVYPINNCLLKL